jgi:lipopolysaccharide biosynthesis glycosyltransferase
MHNVIVTRSDDNVKQLTDITHPMLKKYADKCDANFIILTDDKKPPESHWRILQMYDILTKYNRAIILDSDIILKNNYPNLFNEVPYNCIGSIYEDVGSRQTHRRNLITQVQRERDDVGWLSGYINTGVFVVSECHIDIFDLDITKVWRGFGEDDVELGYQINKRKIKIYPLDYHLNFMSLFSEEWNSYESRFNALGLHYAGGGWHRWIPQYEHVKQDLIILKRFGMVD